MSFGVSSAPSSTNQPRRPKGSQSGGLGNPFSGLGDWLFGDDKEDVGLPEFEHGDQIRDLINEGISGVRGRTAPQAHGAQIDTGQQAQFRAQQLALARRLGAIGSGQQMGPAELAVQRQAARSVADQQAMARMGRGSNAGAAAYNAAQNVQQIGVGAQGAGQQAALADRLQADQTLMGTLSSARGADIGLAGQQAQLDQQTQLANVDAILRQRGMNDAARAQYLNQLIGMDSTQMAAQLQRDLGVYDPQGMFGAVLGAGSQVGAAIAASDARAKTDIEPAALDELLESVKAFSYNYKDPDKHGQGRKHGVMAQDLEKTKLGHSWVTEDEDGTKVVDYGQAASTILAAALELNRKVGN